MHSSSLLSRSKTLPQNTKSWGIWLNEEYLLTFLKCSKFDSNTVAFSGETNMVGKAKGIWTLLLLFLIWRQGISITYPRVTMNSLCTQG